jgi:thioredoxin-related protein
MNQIPLSNRRFPLLVVATLVVAILSSFGAAAAPAAKAVWSPNMPALLIKAKKSKLPILAYFSGSDWDAWTQKLDKEVLKTQMFADWADKNVLLFQADFLKTPKQYDMYKKQNEELKTKYQISVVPTLLLLDADGEVLARAVYDNVKLLVDEAPGQPVSAIAFLTNMVVNKADVEKLITYPSLEATLENAKSHKLPVLLLVTSNKFEKDPMLLEAEKLVQNQRFVRWVNINTSFRYMKMPDDADKTPEAGIYRGLHTKYKFGNSPAQLLLFAPNEEQVRYRLGVWSVLQMEPIMLNLQKNLPQIPYLGTTWLTDLRTAQAIVSQQPKRVLFLYFADGTEYCKKFEKEILETEEFTSWPFHHLVLVKFDFTKGVERPKLLNQQNEEQANLYGVRGYPFCIIVNNKGQKIGEAKYQKGGPTPFIDEMKRIYQADVDKRLLTPFDVEAPVPPKD